MKLVKIDGLVLLIIMLDNSKVFIYQDINYFSEKDSERFRFKLVINPVLLKPNIQIDDSLC